jgi:hypothetical protein
MRNVGQIASILEFDHTLNTRQLFYQFNQLVEEMMLAQQHQEIQKCQQKAWHDRHIKEKDINNGDRVLLYDNRVKGKMSKLETAWLDSYVVEDMLMGEIDRPSTGRASPVQGCLNNPSHLV